MNVVAALEPESATPVRFTVEQFLRMIDIDLFPDEHVELVRGEIIQLSPAHSPHGNLHARVIHEIAKLYGIDRVYADAFIRLDAESLRAFDVAVLHAGTAPGSVLKPEEILLGVEVAHTSIDRDLGEKKLHYAASGITHYMVVDLNARELLLMTEPGSNGFARLQRASFADGLRLPEDLHLRLA